MTTVAPASVNGVLSLGRKPPIATRKSANTQPFSGSRMLASARRANTSNGIGCGLVILVGVAVGLYMAFVGNKGKKSQGNSGSDDGVYVPIDDSSHGHDHGGWGGDGCGDCG